MLDCPSLGTIKAFPEMLLLFDRDTWSFIMDRDTRNLIFDLANLMIDHLPHGEPDSWPLPEASLRAARGRLPEHESQSAERELLA